MCDVVRPRISVVTPSLNHGRFLRDTIESVANQSQRDFEHIVIDGGSTDETLDILKQYPHVRWISEPDGHIYEAYQKGFSMARGKFIIQCCVSDGFLDRHWFKKCLQVLDADIQVSLVWGLPQYMSEEGHLLNVSYQEFFNDPPPQKQEFLALWLANGMVFPEGNYCVRADVIQRYFPNAQSEKHFQIHCHLGFMYHFMVQGYCPFFIPAVANFGRTHQDQRGQRLREIEGPAQAAYFQCVKNYGRNLLKGRVRHLFHDGSSAVMGEIGPGDRWPLRRRIWRHRLLRSPLLRRDPYSLVLKVARRLRG